MRHPVFDVPPPAAPAFPDSDRSAPAGRSAANRRASFRYPAACGTPAPQASAAHPLAFHLHIAGLQRREVDSRYYFSMHRHQQSISRQKIWQDGILFRAGHQLIHGVDHRLQPLQTLDAIDHRRLAYINGQRSPGYRRPNMAQQRLPGGARQQQPSERGHKNHSQQHAEDQRKRKLWERPARLSGGRNLGIAARHNIGYHRRICHLAWRPTHRDRRKSFSHIAAVIPRLHHGVISSRR
jgi:hypothetical protein